MLIRPKLFGLGAGLDIIYAHFEAGPGLVVQPEKRI